MSYFWQSNYIMRDLNKFIWWNLRLFAIYGPTNGSHQFCENKCKLLEMPMFKDKKDLAISMTFERPTDIIQQISPHYYLIHFCCHTNFATPPNRMIQIQEIRLSDFWHLGVLHLISFRCCRFWFWNITVVLAVKLSGSGRDFSSHVAVIILECLRAVVKIAIFGFLPIPKE